MASEGQTRTSRRRASAPDSERQDTERVILKRERVIVVTELVPEDVTDVALDALKEAAKSKGGSRASVREAWVEVGREKGQDKRNAIKAYAGTPGTPDAKPGVYKAPGVTAFSGGMVYERPPEPKVEAKPLDD